MKKGVHYFLIIGVGVLLVFLINLGRMFIEASKLKFVPQPNDVKEILHLNEHPQLIYQKTQTLDTINFVSNYLYDNGKYELIVFKKEIKLNSHILDHINFINKHSSVENQLYLIFESSGIEYRPKNYYINSISLLIENFKNYYVSRIDKDLLYVKFPINKTFGIKFNNEIDLVANKNTDLSSEYNELMILHRDKFLYFLYLKPLGKGVENKEGILKKII
ncbi:hypothetical protein ACG2LH_07135 [Zhouia sp. PK063]|uniref:hypothetical protein n=1 Tax=Zhouia sp. PK063 TaxID=3373602 RepID=UPI00378D21E4